MATAKSALAGLIRRHQEKASGFPIGRLQDLAQADVDLLEPLINAGPPIARWRVGGFYGGDGGAISTLLLTEDVLVVGPILVQQYCVISDIGVDITTAASEGNFYTALYRDRGDGYPGASVHVSAALPITQAFQSTGSLAIELTPGLYWGGAVCNQVTTTVATVRSLTNNSRFVGETAGANDVACAGYSMAAQTGAPAATFTATPTVVGAVPRLLLKVAST